MYLLDNNIRERDESVRGATERLFEGRGSPATRQFQGKIRQPMSTIYVVAQPLLLLLLRLLWFCCSDYQHTHSNAVAGPLFCAWLTVTGHDSSVCVTSHKLIFTNSNAYYVRFSPKHARLPSFSSTIIVLVLGVFVLVLDPSNCCSHVVGGGVLIIPTPHHMLKLSLCAHHSRSHRRH